MSPRTILQSLRRTLLRWWGGLYARHPTSPRQTTEGDKGGLLFIEVKLRRAVQSAVDERHVHIEDLPRDSGGSAKIALIAIDRSIAAWARLRKHFAAEHGDAILDILVQLERLRRAAETKFPDARECRRPGFD